jgi:RHS repeat-associated protein
VETPSSPTSPQWLKNYFFLGARLLATQQPSGSVESVLFYHPDQLGTRLISNPLTGVVTEQTTLPFGTAFAAETSGATNRRFTSYDRSASTGLDYAINRQYDSFQGRFTQADPIGMKAADPSDPQSLNLYSYCGNDPVNHLDPNGLLFGGLFKKIGHFFGSVASVAKAIGRSLSRVGTVLAKVLHNRWVMLGIGILSLIAPPIWAIYQTASELTMVLQTGGLLLQGKWKEFGMAVLAAVKQYVINKAANWLIEKLEGFIYGMDIIKLSACAQAQLAKYFKLTERVVGSMRLHIGHPGFGHPTLRGRPVGALTWGNDVYTFGYKMSDLGSAWAIDQLGHESVHTLEAKVLGKHMFMLSYAVGGIWSILHGKSPAKPPNFLETPAEAAQGGIYKDYTGQGAQVCPASR